MARVYSKLLKTAHAGTTQDYVVPAGYTAVIRWCTAFNANAIANGPAQLVHVASSCTIFQLSLGPQEWRGIGMRFVANEGDTVQLNPGSDVDITISGYELALP